MVLVLQSANSAVLIIKYLSRNKHIVYFLLKKINKLIQFLEDNIWKTDDLFSSKIYEEGGAWSRMQIRRGDNNQLSNEIINYCYLNYHLYITGIWLKILNHCHYLFSFLKKIRNIFSIQVTLLLMILMKLLIFLSVYNFNVTKRIRICLSLNITSSVSHILPKEIGKLLACY